MKKLIVTIITAMFLLSGCGPEHTTERLDKIISEIPNDKKVKKHLKSVTYIEIERSDSEAKNPYYYYDIVASLNDSFDNLQPKEQYENLASIAKIINKHSGTPKDKDDTGELFCGEGVKCEIQNIVLKTEKHEYYANYNLPYLAGGWLHLDDKNKSVDEQNIIYDASAKDGVYVKPQKTETSTTTPSTSSTQSSDDEVEKIKSATGREWVELSFDEKFIYVQTVIESMKSAGRSVTADAYWFIDALNAFYGDGKDSTATEKIIDVMALSGVSGGVIN